MSYDIKIAYRITFYKKGEFEGAYRFYKDLESMAKWLAKEASNIHAVTVDRVNVRLQKGHDLKWRDKIVQINWLSEGGYEKETIVACIPEMLADTFAEITRRGSVVRSVHDHRILED